MKNKYFQRTACLGAILLLALVIVLCVFTWREWRQEKLNQTLLAAVEADDCTQAQQCLQWGADANTVNSTQSASFLWQAFLTLGHKTEPRLDPLNSTVLHLAVSQNDLKLVKLLLRSGAALEAVNSQGQTVLHLAAEDDNNNTQIVSFLLAQGAKVNVQDRNGNTPLMAAINPGNFEGIRILLAHGADIRIKNHYGSTALWLARRGDYAQPEAAKLLKQAGATE